jgi:hypothetical protein
MTMYLSQLPLSNAELLQISFRCLIYLLPQLEFHYGIKISSLYTECRMKDGNSHLVCQALSVYNFRYRRAIFQYSQQNFQRANYVEYYYR